MFRKSENIWHFEYKHPAWIGEGWKIVKYFRMLSLDQTLKFTFPPYCQPLETLYLRTTNNLTWTVDLINTIIESRMLLGITQNYELLLLHLNTTPDLVWLSENHHQNQETIQYTIFNSNWLTVTTEWCRCGDMSLCHWVSMFNILMSMSVLGCGGVYSAADCWQQTRLGWAGHHRGWAAAEQMVRKLDHWTSHSLVPGSCGRGRGCERGGDIILIRTPEPFHDVA